MVESVVGFIKELKVRNEYLFYFGLLCVIVSIVCIVLTKTTVIQVHGVNAWFKPFKFAVSIGLFSCTMAWYCHYLSDFNVTPFNWTVIILFGFELLYIIYQASQGQMSHFNISTPTYSMLYSLMGLAATIVTLYTAYIGFLFFTQTFPDLPNYYIWAIRFGILIFVVFSCLFVVLLTAYVSNSKELDLNLILSPRLLPENINNSELSLSSYLDIILECKFPLA